jgi:hypothetical protein
MLLAELSALWGVRVSATTVLQFAAEKTQGDLAHCEPSESGEIECGVEQRPDDARAREAQERWYGEHGRAIPTGDLEADLGHVWFGDSRSLYDESLELSDNGRVIDKLVSTFLDAGGRTVGLTVHVSHGPDDAAMAGVLGQTGASRHRHRAHRGRLRRGRRELPPGLRQGGGARGRGARCAAGGPWCAGPGDGP